MSETHDRDFKGIWIPKEIWLDSSMTLQEKIMLVEIHSLDNEKGCFASNEYFAKFFDISTVRISQIINHLIEKGFVVNGGFDGRRRILRTSLKLSLMADLSLNKSENSKTISSHKETLMHNNPVSNTLNNPKNNTIKNNHISIFNNLYIAKDFGVPQSLIEDQEKIDWTNICKDAVYIILDFVKYRKETKSKPVKTALMMNNILDTIRGKSEKEIYNDCLKAMGSGGGWLLPNYDHLNKQEKKDKFVEGLSKIK